MLLNPDGTFIQNAAGDHKGGYIADEAQRAESSSCLDNGSRYYVETHVVMTHTANHWALDDQQDEDIIFWAGMEYQTSDQSNCITSDDEDTSRNEMIRVMIFESITSTTDDISDLTRVNLAINYDPAKSSNQNMRIHGIFPMNI